MEKWNPPCVGGQLQNVHCHNNQPTACMNNIPVHTQSEGCLAYRIVGWKSHIMATVLYRFSAMSQQSTVSVYEQYKSDQLNRFTKYFCKYSRKLHFFPETVYCHQYQRCHWSKLSGLMTQCFYVKRRKLRRKWGWMIVKTRRVNWKWWVPLKTKKKMMGAAYYRWNGTILDYCSCVPVDLFADWCFVPNLWRNQTVHFSVWGIRSEGLIRIKACSDLRSLRVQEIWYVVCTNAVQWQEERSIWSQPKNGCV